MKTPKKVIEKISLPLMFVTFVMAVLVFAVSPVSAAPGCVDADGDLYDKFHRKHCPEGDDFDDSDPCNPDGFADACDDPVSGTTPTLYTAQLTGGAFRFVTDLGNPIPVTTAGNQGLGLESVFDVEMRRPSDEYLQVLQDTWDNMFTTGCPNLVPMGDYVDKILSSSDNWTIEEPGNIRVILRDIRLKAVDNVDWDVTVQLIGSENYDPYLDWLPAVGEGSHTFTLTRGRMWGREVRGGQGGRMSCYSGGSDIGAFNLGGDSVLEIAIP